MWPPYSDERRPHSVGLRQTSRLVLEAKTFVMRGELDVQVPRI